MIFGNLLRFLIFVIVVFLIPGYILTHKGPIKDFLSKIFLSLVVGIVLLTLVSFLLGYLNIRWAIFLYIPFSLGSLIIFRKYFKDSWIFPKLNNFNLLPIVIILAGAVFQNSITAKSGRIYDFGMGFWGPLGRDAVWHQALTNELIKNFPPENPAFSGEKLSNYHYFYNLLVAETAKLTGISTADLIYRLYPILFSTLLGVGVYFLAKTLFKDKKAILFSIFFVYFGSSFGWIVEWIKSGLPVGGESTFWANQPVSFNLNPPFAISLIIFIAVILSLKNFLERKDKSSALILILLAGTLVEFKVYAGVIVLAGLFLLGLKRALRKDFRLLLISVISLLLSLILFLPQNKNSTSLLVVSPFWLVNSMVQFVDRVGWEKLASATTTYFTQKIWLKFLLAETLALVIFLVGNLGTRIVSIFAIRDLFRILIKNDGHFFVFSMTLVSFTIPLVFIQKGNSWNIVQFFYYFLFLVALYSGVGLVKIMETLPKTLSFVVVGLILLVTPISSFWTFRSGFYPEPPAKLSFDELAGLNYLAGRKEGTVLVAPFKKEVHAKFDDPYPLFAYAPNPYVSAFSTKRTYLEDVEQQIILQVPYEERLANIEKFFFGLDFDWQRDFLRRENISYIYLPKGYGVLLNEGDIEIKKIFENKEVDIYEVI